MQNILNLDKNEMTILQLLPEYSTPLAISKQCNIPRSTIYIALERLQKRGFVKKRKMGNKIFWVRSDANSIQEQISDILQLIQTNQDEKRDYRVHAEKIVDVSIHKGKQPIIKMFEDVIKNSEDDRLLFIQGDHVGNSWAKVVGSQVINDVNKRIKAHELVTEMITSETWFRLQAKIFGKEWAKNFEGRTARFNLLESAYLDHDCNMFVFKNSVYLVAMSDELIIKIKNKKIVSMIKQLVKFIQDSSKSFDGNAFLRELIEKAK